MGSGGDDNRWRYRNYGTFRNPDQIYFLPYTGKAKIIFDVQNVLKTRIPQNSWVSSGISPTTNTSSAGISLIQNK